MIVTVIAIASPGVHPGEGERLPAHGRPGWIAATIAAAENP